MYYNVTLRRVHELLLPWKNNKYHIFVCVCVCARACSLVYLACNSYAPCCVVICGPSVFSIFFYIFSQTAGFSTKSY